MKIAFVYDVIYPYVKGGVEKRIRELAVRLAAEGHDVHIIGMKFWAGPDTLEKDGIILHGICPAQPLYANGRRTIREALSFSFRLFPFLMREKFDIIDCQQFPYFPVFPVKIAAILKGQPFVITWHEVWKDYWYEYLGWKGVFGKATEHLVARLTTGTIAVSRMTARKMQDLGIRAEPLLIPNGVDPDKLETVQPSAEKSDIIFVGRLIKEKHVDILVRAFAMLHAESPSLTMLIIGDGPERDAIGSLIRSLGIEDSVRLRPFLDSHDMVISLMKSAHVCVIPSTREGFGMTALEALACGLPVVAVDHPDNAICELISEQTGFLSSLSAEDIADKIRSSLQAYPAMRAACIASARKYDWNGIVVLLENHYKSLITR